MIDLQVVSEELVHLADAGGDAEVNGSVADLDDESTNDVGVDLERSCEFIFKMNGDIPPGVDGESEGKELRHTALVTLSFLPWPT
jgi:hypothetical protein